MLVTSHLYAFDQSAFDLEDVRNDAEDNETMYPKGPSDPQIRVSNGPMVLPWANARIVAGFPSPADDTGYQRIDLTHELVTHPQATFLLDVEGPSMIKFGLFDRSRVMVNRALEPLHEDIVVAVIDNLFTLKKLYHLHGCVKLQAGNDDYADIVFEDGQTLQVWGVVTVGITQFRRLRR